MTFLAVSEQLHDQIRSLYAAGRSLPEIAAETHVGKSTVYRYTVAARAMDRRCACGKTLRHAGSCYAIYPNTPDGWRDHRAKLNVDIVRLARELAEARVTLMELNAKLSESDQARLYRESVKRHPGATFSMAAMREPDPSVGLRIAAEVAMAKKRLLAA